MEQRKLIKFGNSSFVISLPNQWIKKNKLAKGYAVFLKENEENELIISPTITERKKEIKRVTINVTGKDVARLKREIISAYIQDYSIIKLIGKDLKDHEEDIRSAINNLMGLEIIEQTSEWIIAKDFLNLEDSSIMGLVKRIDINVRSMFQDAKKVQSEKDYNSILSREDEINKLWCLVLRATKYYLSGPDSQKTTKMSTIQLFSFWNLMYCIEELGDKLKRLAKAYLKIKGEKKVISQINEIYDRVEITYSEMMKAYYTNNQILAFKLSTEKSEIEKMGEKLNEECWNVKYTPLLVSLLIDASTTIHNIGKVVYSYNPSNNGETKD
jgi:phosphate uptake regulator